MNKLTHRLAALTAERLRGIGRGLEKESLRVQADGALALTPHPQALGSALTHPHITTDFSESQLELVTGVHPSVEACLQELTDIHRVVVHGLAAEGDERLWASSMPCRLPPDELIPLGMYGRSNVGRAKTVYRMGLSHRYGRRMQTISGIHYNWSLPGVDSQAYFDLIRNFRRHAFLLLVLLGASPAVCSSFVADRPHGLQQLGPRSMGLPHATSLRMGRLGYQSDAQASLAVSYNCLQSYASSLEEALTVPYPPYEAIGIQSPSGEYNQLATTLLQIENEFYGTIRPKRVTAPGERPLHALRERGVEYVEVRLLDLNPYEPVGIGAQSLRLIDVFLLHCLLSDSPPDDPGEIAEVKHNQHLAAARGREPGLKLSRRGQPVALVDWAEQLLAEMLPIAQHLDQSLGGDAHAQAVAAARAALQNPAQLPSASILQDVAEQHAGNYMLFARECSGQLHQHLLSQPPDAALAARFAALAAESHAKQLDIEAADTLSFEDYRRQYVSPAGLSL